MSTRIYGLFLLLLGVGLIHAEHTCAQGRLRMHAAGSVTKALSPANFSNRYSAGLGGAATVGYELDRIGFEPMLTFGYTRYDIDPTSIGAEAADIDGGDRSIWSLSAGTYFHMNSGQRSYRGRTHLYALVQIGIHGVQIDGATVRSPDGTAGWESRSDTKWGGRLGVGLEVPMVDRFSFKLEPVLNAISTPGERTTVFLLNGGFIYNSR